MIVNTERMLNWKRCVVRRTRNLRHSQVHNERTVPTIMAGYITHARNGHISTSALKSDVTIMFLDPDFLQDTTRHCAMKFYSYFKTRFFLCHNDIKKG